MDSAAGRVEVVVQFEDGADSGPAGEAAAEAGVTLDSMHPARSAEAISFAVYSSDSLGLKQLTSIFRDVPGVLAVSPNSVMSVSRWPNDPAFSRQWGMENYGQILGTADADIDATAAWDITAGSSDVVIAVIDTGVKYDHPDLAANMWRNPGEVGGDGIDNDGNGYVDDVFGIDTLAGDSNPWDESGHGTNIAGVIAAVGNNGVGIAGVAWNAKIMALRAGNAYGLSTADVDECIMYAIDMKLNHGVNVVAINASFAGYSFNEAEKNAIQAAGDAGIVFCAAADNRGYDNDSTPAYPASYDCSNIIAVGASDTYDNKASFSNYGATSVDLFAPGEGVFTTAVRGTKYYPARRDVFYDDVESGSGNWTAGGGWTTYYDSGDDNHYWDDGVLADNGDVRLTSRSINLAWLKNQRPRIGFSVACDYEFDYDFGLLEVSGDGGRSWRAIWYATGQSGGWDLANVEIPNAYLTSQFKMRFRSVTDGSYPSQGMSVDDIGIEWPGYGSTAGTSIATPYVTGAVALLAANAPWKSMNARMADLLSSVDRPSTLSGLCSSNGRLNAGAALRKSASSLVQDSDTRITFLGSWYTSYNAAVSGGSFKYTSQRPDSPPAALVEFTGTEVVLLARTTPWYGMAWVTLDDEPRELVDLYSSGIAFKQPVYAATGLAPGPHKLIMEFASTTRYDGGGLAISLDAVDVSGAVTQADAPVRHQQDDPYVEYRGGWTTSPTWSASGGSYASVNAPGCSVNVTFEGTYLAWYAVTAPWYGRAQVTLDGRGDMSVDMYSSSVKYKQKVYDTGLLEYGTHTLSIYCTGPAALFGPRTAINVDTFDVLGDLTDAPEAGLIRWTYEQSDSRITYLGNWGRANNSTPWGGTFDYTSSPGAAALVDFTGTSVEVFARVAPWYGKALVTLDGGTPDEVTREADFYNSSVNYSPVFTEEGLSPGPHTLAIKCLGAKRPESSGYSIGIESFYIMGYLDQAPKTTRIQESDAAWTLAGDLACEGVWSTGTTWLASGGSFKSGNGTGAKLTVTFEGTYLSWLGRTAPWYGRARVTLDPLGVNIVTTVDLYSATITWKKPIYNTGLLADGPHTVVIEWLGSKYWASGGTAIGVDAFDILTSTP
jgi:subtilisin family serine protease